jgi:hypothetical protein
MLKRLSLDLVSSAKASRIRYHTQIPECHFSFHYNEQLQHFLARTQEHLIARKEMSFTSSLENAA